MNACCCDISTLTTSSSPVYVTHCHHSPEQHAVLLCFYFCSRDKVTTASQISQTIPAGIEKNWMVYQRNQISCFLAIPPMQPFWGLTWTPALNQASCRIGTSPPSDPSLKLKARRQEQSSTRNVTSLNSIYPSCNVARNILLWFTVRNE